MKDYRWLLKGETIREGDEFYCLCGRWHKVQFREIGMSVDMDGNYQRKCGKKVERRKLQEGK